MADVLFYEKPVALSKIAHKDTKIEVGKTDFSFAEETNAVFLAGVEFAQAAKEYSIVFVAGVEEVIPVALLGLKKDQNLFVSDENNWKADYIPAYVRRYPFVLAEAVSGTGMTVCIDESFEGLNKEKGEALFDVEGENTEFLQRALDFLRDYQGQFNLSLQFTKKLKELDLLMNLSAKADLAGGEKINVSGFMVVDEKKMLALDPEDAMALFRSGELGWIYSHLISLGNMNKLVGWLGE